MNTAFSNFQKYWFTHTNSLKVEVYEKSNLSKCIRTITVSDWENCIADPAMSEDFQLYMQRPEWSIGRSIENFVDFSSAQNNSTEMLTMIYDQLITGVVCLRAFQSTRDVNRGEAVAAKIIEYLKSTDFYTAPASTKYHESVTSGLLFHSLKVYNEAVLLQKLPAFESCNVCKWALVALVHDWCKIGLYESYFRNVKNEITGSWEKVNSFRVAETKCNNTLGHGTASMFMISQFLHLAMDEALAIRWHMGPWNVCQSEFNDLQDSNEKYPLVHMLQFADQLAITRYESARYAQDTQR